ncbi:hypothetical protein Q765_15545 [Flavobacterium rivuli WB 3.3-2 = DSM 21788]|uniref:Uncharacterized protein n=1 Tax=Flavobacterium rivuli WB 3.3-2 = DSM 21788 TaxID=1121895 RepID=A0A0A2LZ35_9FLAO|nr:T9SS type A sorting domain-containing protein [Flavobacterium rivuli]KGO85622.1 hypothetical protein Q765_15545 [Flavobacterium rivuli WB 3.3-2 = DSM 21788]
MKTTLLCLLLLFTGIAGAQIVTIPDANFKASLLAANTTTDVAKDAAGQNMVIDSNNNGEIEESEALLVYELAVANQSIASMVGVEAFTNLTSLRCNLNQLTSLNVSACVNLTGLYCSYNYLTTLDVSALTNLQILYAGSNQLTQLNTTGCYALTEFFCSENNLTSLNLTGHNALSLLFCASNQLSVLDLSPVNLTLLNAGDNLFTTVDLSAQSNLTEINLYGSAVLESVYLKNGTDQNLNLETFWDCNALNFVCVDESEIDIAYTVLSTTPGIDMDALQLTSYCSFTPGSLYNTITGTVTFDADNNGCDSADAPRSFIKVSINDGTQTGSVFTNRDGNYIYYTQAGIFTVAPQFEDNWYTAAPTTATVVFPVVDNSIATENFCVTANSMHPDVEVVMVPVSNARPGFDALYKIVYKNKGNQILSGRVSCGWDTTILAPVLLDPFPDGMAPDTYSWDYINLQPFESREILMTLNVNSPTEVPAVNDGDVLAFTASANSGYTDETPDDNYFEFNQRVVNSLDPNNIVCVEGDTETTDAIGDYLHYVVNFENTGTAPAEFVVITHDIDPTEYDIDTVEILNASHDVRARISGNRIEFAFAGIQLGVAAHGNILFKLKSRASLQQGDIVINRANIFFDYNSPLATNNASTVFALLSTGNFAKDASVQVYPNPAKNTVTVKADGNIQSLQLYDIQGRLLQTTVVNDTLQLLDLSSRTSGMYFVKVTTEKGVSVEKIIKE